jgi:hypothetical protein
MIPFNGLHRPLGKYKEIFDYVLAPSPEVKSVDLCCGLGFGKTLIGIQIAACTLDSAPGHVGMFLEPDWDRIDNIFLPMWEEYVPSELYEIKVGKNWIIWKPTGSRLVYRPRVITGSLAQRRARNRGIPTTFVIDDETAISFDKEQYQNTYARVRLPADIRYYLTLSTPLVGPYGNFLKRGNNKIFHGRTRDNFYLLQEDPTYESRQRANMSPEQARRELDGELVALEGRIWKTAKLDESWPFGNRNDFHTCFKKGEPWWLLCDLGGANGAYIAVQQTDGLYRGRKLYEKPVWVSIADFCPDDDASASRAFQKMDQEFGIPAGVVAGADVNTRASTDGLTVAYFVKQIWGNTHIYPCNESILNKQIQGNCFDQLLCTTTGERRFTVAKNFVSLENPRSNRGVREVLNEDQWPPKEKLRVNDVYPKNPDIIVQHARDALLMGSARIMNPPKWFKQTAPAG